MEAVQSNYIVSNQNNVELLPYVRINGEYTLADHVLAGFFHQLQDEGTAAIIFQDGHICNADDFISYMQEDRNLPAFAFIDNKIVGLAWLNQVSGKHAFAHFALLKSTWGKHSEEIGNHYLRYWFSIPAHNGGYLLDAILGFIPAHNKAANAYIKRLGFIEVGEVPSMLYNAFSNEYESGILSYVQR